MTGEDCDFKINDALEDNLPTLVELLGHLTQVAAMDSMALRRIFHERSQAGIVTRVAVHNPSGRVIGTASLMIEPKFFRGGKPVGHIEDVVVDPAYRGKKIGEALIRDLCGIAHSKGCYKVILDSAEKAIEFYEKLGFKIHERQMRLDFSHL